MVVVEWRGGWGANDGKNSPYRECYCTLIQLDLHFKGNREEVTCT